ncbi:MAG: acyl-CoA thioesterase [Bdellovibrionales bacterium]|nr:acyl-CoA thioesterase [Bdellovibrionales bacterium]
MVSTPGEFCYTLPPLRFGLFDLGGVLYHANYFGLYEDAREELLRREGYSYESIAAGKAHLAIVETTQRFLRPIRYGDEVRLRIRSADIGRSSFTLKYRIETSAYPDTVHEASTRFVFVQETAGQLKTSRLPPKLVAIIEKFS